jgi:hypothetical protein
VIAIAGVDTWSPCWYVDRQSSAAEMLDALASTPATRGRLLPDPVGGHRIGWNKAAGMLYAEGHPEADGLAPPDDLVERLRELEEQLLEYGVPLPPGTVHSGSVLAQTDDLDGFGGVRRCDATVDLRVGSRAQGLAILAGAAAIATTTPRAQGQVFYAKDGTGSVETVYLRGSSGVKVLGRWYDKGLESWGPGRRGERIRIEDQRRYPKGHRRDVAELSSAYVRAKLQDRFLPMYRASKGVKVAGQVVLIDKLCELAESGQLRPAQAERLAGYLAVRRRGFSGRDWSQREREAYERLERDRKRSLRELGLVEASGAIEEVEVDLHEVLELALDGAAWGARG